MLAEVFSETIIHILKETRFIANRNTTFAHLITAEFPKQN